MNHYKETKEENIIGVVPNFHVSNSAGHLGGRSPLLSRAWQAIFHFAMLAARVVILLLVHAFLSQCAPRVPQKSKKAFTIPQSDPKPFIIPGPAALAGIYGKYNKVIPPEVQAAAEYNDGTINADPEEFDSQYLCPVNIGGETFNLGFDSGSSDL